MQLFPLVSLAGNLDNSSTPAEGSGMPTTKAIFQQLSSGKITAIPGAFQEPTSGPGSSGRSLSEIQRKLPTFATISAARPSDVKAGMKYWGLKDGSWGVQTGTYVTVFAKRVNKTGQTTSYATGDDGQYQYGIDPPFLVTPGITGAYNTPPLVSGARFTDNGDGTVIDNLTALIWLKNASCFGQHTWNDALISANTLKGNNSQCSLNDGSTAGQWRLPNINELHSLGPTWIPASPFTDVQVDGYWSSSTFNYDSRFAWYLYMNNGNVISEYKLSYYHYVWPVRGGQ
jgi:hypothetical protein